MEFLIEKVFEQFEKNLRIVLEKHDVEIETIKDKMEVARSEIRDSIKTIAVAEDKNIKELQDKIDALEKANINARWKLALICSCLGASIGAGSSIGIKEILALIAKF